MAKTSDQKLFLLIQSLTKTEKSYFRKQSRTFAEDSVYGQLFDILSLQKKYDEALAIKQLKTPVSQFSVLKNYLYEAILDSLVQYRSDKGEAQRLLQIKQKVSVLAEKKLYEPAVQLLSKAIKQAIECEFFTLAIDFISIEYKLYTNWKPLDLSFYTESWKLMDRCIELLRNQHQYQQLNIEFIYWQRKERALRNTKVLEELERIMQNPFLKDIQFAESFLSKLLFFSTHDGYAKIQGNYEEATNYTRQMLQLYEQSPKMQQRDPQNHLSTIINHLNNCYYTQRHEELLEGLGKLQKLHFDDSKLENFRFSRYAVLYLNYIKISKDYSYFNFLTNEIQIYLNENKNKITITEKRLLYYNSTELYIQQKNYEAAADMCIMLNALPATDTQTDLQRFGRLLEILIHYELGNTLLVESLCQNARHRLSQKQELHQYEALFIALFHKLATAPLLDIKDILKQYLSKFEQLVLDFPGEKKAMDYFDIGGWIVHHLKNGAL